MGYSVFVSHAHDDVQLVKSLETVIDGTLDDVQVRSSSSRPTRGGIEPGASWLEWINKSVRESDATIIVLTAASYNRPWLLWEAGAVSGVSLAEEGHKPIIPVVFELPLDSVPAPLRHQQFVDGARASGITDILEMMHAHVQRPGKLKFEQLLELKVPEYLRNVSAILAERRVPKAIAAPSTTRGVYHKTFQGEDLDLTVVNFTTLQDPDDMSGVAIVNGAGDWIIEIDVESPLRGQRHTADLRFRRSSPSVRGLIAFSVDSGEVHRHEEVIDLSQVRHHKYVVEYLAFRHNSRVAKVTIRPVDDEARKPGVFCLDSVSVYSLPHGGERRT